MLLRVVALAVLTACSATVTTPDVNSTARFSSNEQLTFTVTDAPAMPGLMFITGTVTGGQGVVTVSSTRYGSVCATNITANAVVANGKITFTAKYSARAAICTADIRAITYHAEIRGLAPGGYDIDVVHTNPDGSTGTVLTQHVSVN